MSTERKERDIKKENVSIMPTVRKKKRSQEGRRARGGNWLSAVRREQDGEGWPKLVKKKSVNIFCLAKHKAL